MCTFMPEIPTSFLSVPEEPPSPRRKAARSRWTLARKLWSRKSATIEAVKPPEPEIPSSPEAEDPVVELYRRACDLEEIAEQSQLRVLDTKEKLSEATELAEKNQKREVYWRSMVCQVVDMERGHQRPTSHRFQRL